MSNIERWIPPPTIEEEDRPRPSAPESTDVQPTIIKQGDQTGWITPPPIVEDDRPHASAPESKDVRTPHHPEFDDDDVDTALVNRLKELAIRSVRRGEFAQAENFYRKVLDRVQSDDASSHDLTTTQINLAYTYLERRKWAEAERLINTIAFGKDVADLKAYTTLHVLALAHLKTSRLEDAERYCKRALWGRRKILGKTDPLCWDTLDLLAHICNTKSDPLEAEAHRSFLPASYPQAVTADDPVEYLLHTIRDDFSFRQPPRQDELPQVALSPRILPLPRPALVVGIQCSIEETAVALAYVADEGILEYDINERPNDRGSQKNTVSLKQSQRASRKSHHVATGLTSPRSLAFLLRPASTDHRLG